jgi:hypothetical protein
MRTQLVRFTLLGAMAALLASCGSNEAELRQYAQKRKMGEKETAAFMACANGFGRNKPTFPARDGTLVMKSVPYDICACQVKTITAVFIENEYKAVASFAEYMALEVKKRPPRFSKKTLKHGLKSPDAAKKLEAGFNACVQSYTAANKERSAELFELVPLKEPEKKDGKEAKKASS